MTTTIKIGTTKEYIDVSIPSRVVDHLSFKSAFTLIQGEVDKALEIDPYRATIMVALRGPYGGWGRECVVKFVFDLVDATCETKISENYSAPRSLMI